eukprot:403335539
MSEVRLFLSDLARSMGKDPSMMENFIQTLEDNWLETVDALKSVTNEQWIELKLPMGVVNQIKKRLQETGGDVQMQTSGSAQSMGTGIQMGAQVKQPVKLQDQEMIDTSSGFSSNNQGSRNYEEHKQSDLKVECLQALTNLNIEQSVDISAHRDTIQTLLKIVANLITKPLDPAVRRLNKTNATVQKKILNHQYACQFLQLVGFDFNKSLDQVEIGHYSKDQLLIGQDAINEHIGNLGGSIKTPVFDPYSSSISSTTFNKLPVQTDPNAQINFYDPSQVTGEIQKIQQERQKAMNQAQVVDRDIKVFNAQSKGTNLKHYLMELDRIEIERLKELKMTEEKLEEAIASKQALMFMAENEKQSHFRNKRQDELEKITKQVVYTTALVRIKFPDDYVLQGHFGALEKVEALYQFVREHLYTPERPFILYQAPPKKNLEDHRQNLKQVRLVPSGTVLFEWVGLEQTRMEDGPFLDIAGLRDKIIAF